MILITNIQAQHPIMDNYRDQGFTSFNQVQEWAEAKGGKPISSS